MAKRTDLKNDVKNDAKNDAREKRVEKPEETQEIESKIPVKPNIPPIPLGVGTWQDLCQTVEWLRLRIEALEQK